MMKLRNIVKASVIGTGAVIGAVIGPPLYAVGVSAAQAYKRTAEFMIRRPHAATLAMITAGLITYGACQHHEYLARQATNITVQAVERYRDMHDQKDAMRPVLEEQHAGLEKAVFEEGDSTPALPEFIKEPGMNYYYVKPRDTLARIAEHITGDAGKYPEIMRHNGIDDTRKIPAGMLLTIPAELCTRKVEDVYTRVPRLEQTLLSDTSISETFPDRWKGILALNRELGLDYTDAYPGERIVYSD